MSDSPAAVLVKSDGTEIGTGSNPVRTDPTGTTAQPVSDGGGSLTVDGPLTDAQLRAVPVPSLLVDSSGNPVGVLLDSGIYRLRTEAKLAGGHGLATESTLANVATESTLAGVKTGTDKIPAASGTGATSNVAAAATDTLLLASNTSRKGMSVYNDSTATLYLKAGLGASATSFTVAIKPKGYWECPYRYTGQINGLWSAANGAARVTEYT